MEFDENPYQSPLTAGGSPDAAPVLPRGVWRTAAALLCAIPAILCLGVAILFWSWYYTNQSLLQTMQLWQHCVLLGYFSFGLIWLTAAIYWWRRRDRWGWGLTLLGLAPIVAVIITEMI
jgi:hypothetical protein